MKKHITELKIFNAVKSLCDKGIYPSQCACMKEMKRSGTNYMSSVENRKRKEAMALLGIPVKPTRWSK